jgi:hypothetical protein
MINSTPLLNTGGKNQMGCHAHLPGSGPAAEICSRCALLVPEGSKFVCSQYRVLTGRTGKPISPNSAACRYFEKRRSFNQGV